MRPPSIYGQRLRGSGWIALCTLLAGCGQTGYLYLVMPATNIAPVTARPAPAPSTQALPVAPCVTVPTPTSNVAPVAAPFAGTEVEGVPYQPGKVPQPAPAAVTDILPPCVVYPSDYIPAHLLAPAATTHAPPKP